MVNITQCKSPNAQTEDPTPVSGLDEIARLVQCSRQLLVLTGAGCSTESGIPDYRDREGAVSYTHLDVYKRQALRTAVILQRRRSSERKATLRLLTTKGKLLHAQASEKASENSMDSGP